jgi:hypothetical protein
MIENVEQVERRWSFKDSCWKLRATAHRPASNPKRLGQITLSCFIDSAQ